MRHDLYERSLPGRSATAARLLAQGNISTQVVVFIAKFALLYAKQPAVVDSGDGPHMDRIISDEPSITEPAVVSINGVFMYSAVPKSAAEAEKINRALRGD